MKFNVHKFHKKNKKIFLTWIVLRFYKKWIKFLIMFKPESSETTKTTLREDEIQSHPVFWYIILQLGNPYISGFYPFADHAFNRNLCRSPEAFFSMFDDVKVVLSLPKTIDPRKDWFSTLFPWSIQHHVVCKPFKTDWWYTIESTCFLKSFHILQISLSVSLDTIFLKSKEARETPKVAWGSRNCMQKHHC